LTNSHELPTVGRIALIALVNWTVKYHEKHSIEESSAKLARDSCEKSLSNNRKINNNDRKYNDKKYGKNKGGKEK
jgi:hypothetical protein